MEETNFNSIFYNKILKNKVLMYLSVFVTILCFGFTITHYSIGLDDPARLHYLFSTGWGNMIQQGRLLHVVFNGLTGIVEFIPFFNEFLGASLFWFSSLIFCGLFQLVSKNRFSTLSMCAFACTYISFPIITEKFIYSLDVVVTMLSYCTCAMALVYAYLFVVQHSKKYFALSISLLMIAIGSYESFVFLYICGVFAILCIQILDCNENMTFKKFICQGLYYASILVISMVIYYTIVTFLQLATNQFKVFGRPNILGLIRSKGLLSTFTLLIEKIAKPIIFGNNTALIIFGIFSCIGIIIFLIYSWKIKNALFSISYLAIWIFSLAISALVGELQARTLQTFCLYISFTLLLLIHIMATNKWKQVCAAILVGILVLVQSATMNRYFYNDYKRYQKEAFVIDCIAKDLMGGYNLSKPIVFIQDVPNKYIDQEDKLGLLRDNGFVNGVSVVNWSVDAFEDNTSSIMFELFEMEGYDFMLQATKEQATHALECSYSQPSFPQAGYICEYSEFIVIKI